MTTLENGLELLLSHAGFILMLFALVAVALLGVLADYLLPDEDPWDGPGSGRRREPRDSGVTRPSNESHLVLLRSPLNAPPAARRSPAPRPDSSSGSRLGPRGLVAGYQPNGFSRPSRWPQRGPLASGRRCIARRFRGSQPDLTQPLEPRAATRN
jgi:hypothetical protein